ncbi:MAG: type IX secretion system membrane protein PorP/SprF [Bacteroidota bacterium]
MKQNLSFIFCILYFVICNLHSSAQQLPQFSQYMVNDYFQNPAVAGSRQYFDAMSANRLQWLGITDAPRTYCISMNGPLQRWNMGVGGYLFTDIVGPTRRIGLSGSYSYHIKLMEKAPYGGDSPMKLSMALSAGILQFAMDGSKLMLNDNTDYVLNHYQSTVVPDFGFGAYLYCDKWWFGTAVPQIYPASLKNLNTYTDIKGKIVMHFYVSGGYKISIADDFSVEPSFIVKYVKPTPIQMDIGTRIIYKQKIWIGGTYRTKDAISIMAGLTYMENLSFGYAYDIITTNLKNYSSGTHELIIAIRFKTYVIPAAPKN